MRDALVRAARALQAAGLNHGSAGNLSVRTGDGMLITPTGLATAGLEAAQMVSLSLDGSAAPGQLRPSSEWRFHAAVYVRRPDVGAVVHTHSPHATALACMRLPLPPLHYTIALSGRDTLPCADYAPFGTQALADAVVAALGEHGRACLMANHGLLVAAGDLDTALALAVEMEFLAKVYLLCRGAGEPVILGDAELDEVRERIAAYGRQD